MTPVAAAAAPLSPWEAIVAHDLKNALGTLETQLADLAETPDRAAARLAHRHCRELRRRLVMLLTVRHRDADGQLPCWPTDESPSDLLAAIAEAANADAGFGGERGLPGGQDAADRLVTVTVDTARAPALWVYDPRLVRLALDAAVDNARRFARSQVRIQASVDDGWLDLDVLDDGPGPTRTLADPRAAHGTGLGMTMCRAISEAHADSGRAGTATLDDLGLPGPDGTPGGRFRLRLP